MHISHYGRICPIETPEGTNIGLIASLAIYSDIDEYGFLITPYRVVKDGHVNGAHKYLRADEEMKAILAPPDIVEKEGQLRQRQRPGSRARRLWRPWPPRKSSTSTSVRERDRLGFGGAILFLEHDDRQPRPRWVPTCSARPCRFCAPIPAIVSTGMERPVAQNSGMVVRAEQRAGVVTYVDAMRHPRRQCFDEYVLRKFVGLNERTWLNQKPIVKKGQRVKKGQIMADGAAVHQGELALGRNVLVAFMTYDGYNFEDAIVISQRLVKQDTFTSIHIEEYDVEIRETKLGREEFTRDIPNVSERALANLDENGVVRVGTRVGPGDILVGKVAPKSKSELTPEEKLLHAIFGRAGEDVKNDSLEMPAGEEGDVIGRPASQPSHAHDRRAEKGPEKGDRRLRERDESPRHQYLQADGGRDQRSPWSADGRSRHPPESRPKRNPRGHPRTDRRIQRRLDQGFQGIQGAGQQHLFPLWPTRVQAVLKEKARRSEHMKRGDELPSGVLEMVKVYVATSCQLSVGDKMAGRHGNKGGVIARIVPDEDMPFLNDGTPVDILLNPLGVPSRMNVGQILETHLGWAMAVLGQQAVTPVFDGALEDEIHKCIEEANTALHTRRKERKSSHVVLGNRELDVDMPWGGKVRSTAAPAKRSSRRRPWATST